MKEPKIREFVPLKVFQQRSVPEAIRALGSLDRIDYVDLFVATTSTAMDVSPEQWARAAVEGASPAGRFLAWRVICGLRLEPQPSPDHVGGWKIADRSDNWTRMEASSWFMTAHIVFQIDEGCVSFATLIRYDRRVAALIWTPVSILHRAVAPDFLRAAVKRVERSR
jgi:hypothetical protein